MLEAAARAPACRPAGGWAAGTDEVVAGGSTPSARVEATPLARIERRAIEESPKGAEADPPIRGGWTGARMVVADRWEKMGRRGRGRGLEQPHADLREGGAQAPRPRDSAHEIAGSPGRADHERDPMAAGDGRRHAALAATAVTDGHASSTVSIRLESGFAVSLPARAASGLLGALALGVSAAGRAGLGDSPCRSRHWIDGGLSHRRLADGHADASDLGGGDDEDARTAPVSGPTSGLPSGGIEAVGRPRRALLRSGRAGGPSLGSPATARGAGTRSSTTPAASRATGAAACRLARRGVARLRPARRAEERRPTRKAATTRDRLAVVAPARQAALLDQGAESGTRLRRRSGDDEVRAGAARRDRGALPRDERERHQPGHLGQPLGGA